MDEGEHSPLKSAMNRIVQRGRPVQNQPRSTNSPIRTIAMNAKYFSSLIVGALAAASVGSSFAADGIITIDGEITANTCTINGGHPDIPVTLPTVSVNSFGSKGATAGETPFTIALTGCTQAGNVHTFFEASPMTNPDTGFLKLEGAGNQGVATGVEIALLNKDFSDIKLGVADAAQNSNAEALTAGAATLTYYARYVAIVDPTATAVTAGEANSRVIYTIAYN
jgi:major type 1 subunit fimbrin (pilin)